MWLDALKNKETTNVESTTPKNSSEEAKMEVAKQERDEEVETTVSDVTGKVSDLKFETIEELRNLNIEELYDKYYKIKNETEKLERKIRDYNSKYNGLDFRKIVNIKERIENHLARNQLEKTKKIKKMLESVLDEKYKNEPESKEILNRFTSVYSKCSSESINLGFATVTCKQEWTVRKIIWTWNYTDKKWYINSSTLSRDDKGNYYETIVEQGEQEKTKLTLEEVCERLYVIRKTKNE